MITHNKPSHICQLKPECFSDSSGYSYARTMACWISVAKIVDILRHLNSTETVALVLFDTLFQPYKTSTV